MLDGAFADWAPALPGNSTNPATAIRIALSRVIARSEIELVEDVGDDIGRVDGLAVLLVAAVGDTTFGIHRIAFRDVGDRPLGRLFVEDRDGHPVGFFASL